MNHTYIFYADVYLLQNFLIKSSALYLTLWYQKYLPKGIFIKICLGAFAGSVIEIVGLLSGFGYNWFIAIVHLFEVPGIMAFLIRKEKKYLVKAIVTGYFFILLINGIQEAFWNVLGEKGSFPFFLLISCGFAIIVVKNLVSYVKTETYLFYVELQNGETCYNVRGFYDTGNRLKEPYGQKKVHIVTKEICDKLMLENTSKLPVPYHALGNTEGILEVFYIDRIKITKEKQVFEILNGAIGIGDKQLFEGKGYEMILNEDVFESVNERI